MDTSIMSTNSDESSYAYRHKKFDQSKRKRTDSFNSSSTETEDLNKSFVTQTNSMELSNTSNDIVVNSQEMPAAKRRRIVSDSETSYPLAFSPLLQQRLKSTLLLSTAVTTFTGPLAQLCVTSNDIGVNANEMPAVKRKRTVSGSERSFSTAFPRLRELCLTSNEGDKETPAAKRKCTAPGSVNSYYSAFTRSPQLCFTSNDIGGSSNENSAAERKRTISGSESSYPASFSPLPSIRLTSTPLPPTVISPAVAPLPKISNETLNSICKYHGNMVRKFPKKERTPKDQERRNKNTIACRNSRRLKKLEHIVIEEQYKEFSQKTFEIIEQSMRATAYLHELMKLSAACSQDQNEKEAVLVNTTTEAAAAAAVLATTTKQKKPFTIAYLTGIEEN